MSRLLLCFFLLLFALPALAEAQVSAKNVVKKAVKRTVQEKTLKEESSGESDEKKSIVDEIIPKESLKIATVYLEDTRDVLSDRVVRLSETVDSLFGNNRTDDEKNLSTFRVSQTYFVRDGELGADNLSTSLNLYLPNLVKWQNRMREKYFSKKDKDKAAGGAAEGGFFEDEKRNWDLNTETGLVVTVPLNYYARLRLRRNFLLGHFENSFYEQVGWSKSNEWEEKTSLTTDFAVSRDLLLRFINEADWAMTRVEFRTHHGPSVIHTLDEHSAISYDLRYNTIMEGHTFYSDSVILSTTYGRRTQIPWIYTKFTPALSWAREDDFSPVWAFYLNIEFVFGSQ